MTTILVIFGVGIVLIVLGLLVKPKQQQKIKGPSVMDVYSERGQIWIKEMADLYDSGLVWSKSPELLYEKRFNLSLPANDRGIKTGGYWEDLGIPDDYLDLPEESIRYKAGDFFHEMERGLMLRFFYQYRPLSSKNESEVMREYGLNIFADELLYYNSVKIDWYDEKVIRQNVSYSGYKYRSGGKMNFNTGAFTVVRNDVIDYVLLDRGSLFITNKRIIFIGNNSRQNRTLRLDDILEISIYKDGLLLGKPNGSKPLVLVPGFKSGLVPRDNLNCVIRILDRLMAGTEAIDLTPAEYKNV